MNKKLIAIAIATVMAAPVAMADVKLSGRMAGHLTNLSTDGAADDSLGYGDQGHSRVQLDATQGSAFARMAWDARGGKNWGQREQYLGYKFGGGVSAQFNRMTSAGKNIEKDPYIATFLQLRNTLAESVTAKQYGSSSFVDHLAQVAFKAGSTKIKIQYDLGSNSAGSPNEGHTAIAVTGKGGPVNYWVSYNNGTADGNNNSLSTSQSNLKLGGSMKFGKVKVSLNYTSSDTDVAGGEQNSTTVWADMGLGNGMSIDVLAAVRAGDTSADDATMVRLAVSKKLAGGAKLYGGVVSKDYDAAGPADTTEIGAGLIVKF